MIEKRTESAVGSRGRSERRHAFESAVFEMYRSMGGQREFRGDFHAWFGQVWTDWEHKLAKHLYGENSMRAEGAEAEIAVIEAYLPEVGRKIRERQEREVAARFGAPGNDE